ncbi:ThiJ/PfpI family protein [Biscogniauxia marginata]|nr:ThiJ/PfpI family protein [Biscogniauxia marginata]
MASAGKSDSGNGRHTVRIGVFIPRECQLLDASSVDIMGSMGYEYMEPLSKLVSQALIDLAPSVRIHYIGSVRAGEPIRLSSNVTIIATNHYSDPEVAPGKLDIVLVPGPDPFLDFPMASFEWLGAQGRTEGVDILSVCTGIFLCGEAGLLMDRTVCGPRGLQDLIKTKGYGEKALVGHELRWRQDGNFWSSGGVTNGNDLVAAYCRATPRHFPAPLVAMTCNMIDVGDRPQEYGKDIESVVAGAVAATTATATARD